MPQSSQRGVSTFNRQLCVNLHPAVTRGYSFEALRAKILFTEGAHKHKLSRPKFERKREQVSVRGYEMADDFVGYGLPTLSRVAPPRPPVLKAVEPHQDETPEKNYGADINTLIELLEEGRL